MEGSLPEVGPEFKEINYLLIFLPREAHRVTVQHSFILQEETWAQMWTSKPCVQTAPSTIGRSKN